MEFTGFLFILAGIFFIAPTFAKKASNEQQAKNIAFYQKYKITFRIFGTIFFLFGLLLVVPVNSKNSLVNVYDKAKEIHTEKYKYDTTTKEEESDSDSTPMHSQSYVISKFNGISSVRIGAISYTKYDDNKTIGRNEDIHAHINCDIERHTGKDCLDTTDILGNGVMMATLEAYDANKSEKYHQEIMKCVHDQACNNEVEDGNLIFHVFRKPVKMTENGTEWSDIIDDVSITIIK